MKRRMITLLCAIILIFTSTAFLASASDSKNIYYLSYEQVYSSVEDYISEYPEYDENCIWDKDTVIFETIPMYDPNGHINAYIFNLSSHSKPVGYIVFETNTDDPGILEYGYGIDCGYYVEATESYKRNQDAKLIYMGGRSVLIEKNNEYLNIVSDKKVEISKTELKAAYVKIYNEAKNVKKEQAKAALQSQSGAVKAAASLPATYNIINLWSPSAFVPELQADLARVYGGSTGNCAPTGVINCIKYYATRRNISGLWKNNSFGDTYRALINTYVPAGSTSSTIYNGFYNYAVSINKPPAGRDYRSKPIFGSIPFDWIQTNIYNNNMLLLSVYVDSYDNSGRDGKHILNAIGYDTTNPNGNTYLRVIDQWYTSLSRFYRWQGGAYLDQAFYLRW